MSYGRGSDDPSLPMNKVAPPSRTAVAITTAEDALICAAQFIDALKGEGEHDGWWTEWDSQMRQKITAALSTINDLKP